MLKRLLIVATTSIVASSYAFGQTTKTTTTVTTTSQTSENNSSTQAQPRFIFSLEGIYTMTRTNEIEYGRVGLFNPQSRNISLDKGWEIRGTASFRLDNNIEIGLGLGWSRLNPVKDSGPGGFLASVNLDPDVTIPAIFSTGTQAKLKESHYVVDAQLAFPLAFNSFKLKIFGGIRYANFDEKINASATALFGLVNIAQQRKQDSWGIGPRVGVAFEMPISSGGLSLVGDFGAAALFGNHKTKTNTTLSLLGFPIINRSVAQKDNRTVYSLEGNLGLAYNFGQSGIQIALGYHFESWVNVDNTQTRRVGGSLVGEKQSDRLQHGPFLKVSFGF
ncbi:MAG: hypothetical protein IPP67_01055 [Rhodospirillaceae bacterium]|nr:hypothetical protein [Rhodospirillaceae bacterium]